MEWQTYGPNDCACFRRGDRPTSLQVLGKLFDFCGRMGFKRNGPRTFVVPDGEMRSVAKFLNDNNTSPLPDGVQLVSYLTQLLVNESHGLPEITDMTAAYSTPKREERGT